MQTRITWTTLLSLALAGCASVVSGPPADASVCEALRPDMPIQYFGRSVDSDDIAKIRRVNARFAAACPLSLSELETALDWAEVRRRSR